ncbi:MAG: tRNA pseudouridine(55) synthase TruB, partial [Bdellovibrionales bacterium]
VDKVRKILKTKEVGHSGTLDPLASGLMAVLVGKATKLSPYITDGDKAYSVEVELGITTDTLDVTGVELSRKPVTEQVWENLESTISKKVGQFNWPVPIYSAVKVQGQKLYEIARSNGTVELPVKEMKFWNVKKIKSSSPSSFWVDIECSKGSFIRTWVDQLGSDLGCGAAMKNLVRTASWPFAIQDAFNFDQLEKMSEAEIQSVIIEMSASLPQMKKVRVQAFDQTLLLNGQLSHDLRRLLIGVVQPESPSFIQVLSKKSQQLLAIIGFEPGVGFKIKRVFN